MGYCYAVILYLDNFHSWGFTRYLILDLGYIMILQRMAYGVFGPAPLAEWSKALQLTAC